MTKICIKDGCSYPQFGGGYCKFHQGYRRNNKGRTLTKIKRPRIKRKPSGEKILFDTIYEENKDNWVSQISGNNLYRPNHGNSQFYWQFAHILPKGLYPNYKMFKSNILLILPREHYLIDHGTEKERKKYSEENNCSFDIFYNKKEELLILYREMMKTSKF